MIMKFTAAALATFACVGARDDVIANTWAQAESTLASADLNLAEVRKHAENAASKESEEVEAAKRSMHESEKELERSVAQFKEAEEKIVSAEAPSAEASADSLESSFIQFPDSFSQFPEVKKDMEAVRAAEKTFKHKMDVLRQQDDSLMKMAKQNYADAGKVANKIRAGLRGNEGKGFSLIEVGSKSMPASFAKVLEAEERLKKVNAQIAQEFNLA